METKHAVKGSSMSSMSVFEGDREMLASATATSRYLEPAGTSSSLPRDRSATRRERDDAPVVAAVDASASGAAAARTAISLARRLGAPVVFVYVRRGPSSILGEPYYQRRLDAEIFAAKRALGAALAVAERAGVAASGEELAGSPARRLVEFARLRGARLVVLGSRRRRFGRSVSRSVIRAADRPVLVAGAPATAIA
jgi:nucleotide-binding universal stress UspA family protein